MRSIEGLPKPQGPEGCAQVFPQSPETGRGGTVADRDEHECAVGVAVGNHLPEDGPNTPPHPIPPDGRTVAPPDRYHDFGGIGLAISDVDPVTAVDAALCDHLADGFPEASIRLAHRLRPRASCAPSSDVVPARAGQPACSYAI